MQASLAAVAVPTIGTAAHSLTSGWGNCSQVASVVAIVRMQMLAAASYNVYWPFAQTSADGWIKVPLWSMVPIWQ